MTHNLQLVQEGHQPQPVRALLGLSYLVPRDQPATTDSSAMGAEVIRRPSQDRNRLSDSAFDLHKKLLKGRTSIDLQADSRPTENGQAQPDFYGQQKELSTERPYEAPLSQDDPEWSQHETTSEIDSKDEPTPDKWVPRHKAIVRLTGR